MGLVVAIAHGDSVEDGARVDDEVAHDVDDAYDFCA